MLSVDCPVTERLATVVVARVEVPVTTNDPVLVAFTLVRLVILAVTALSKVEKKEVEVLLVAKISVKVFTPRKD